MADRITLQVARYRPEEESAVRFQEYEVPCPKEWVVLDGLNYVKDRLDGTLSYRWSSGPISSPRKRDFNWWTAEEIIIAASFSPRMQYSITDRERAEHSKIVSGKRWR